MKTVLFLSVLVLGALQGCSKSEDSNQDANGACKQEYLDSWNAVAKLTKYSSMAEATTACTNLKNKAGVSCRANVMVISGDALSGDRNISYSDYKAVCEAVLEARQTTPSAPSNSYTTPAPNSKYAKLSGGACNQNFLDLYTSLSKKTKLLEIAEKYSSTAGEALQLATDVIGLCAEKRIAELDSASCLAVKNNSYSYYNGSTTVYLSDFDSACARAQASLDVATDLVVAKSTRVLSKIETYSGTVESYSELKKFNSVGGATYLFEGVWLKEASLKAKLVSLAQDIAVCNITTKAVIADGFELAGGPIKIGKESVVNAATQDAVELYKTDFLLTDKFDAASTVKVRCLKKSEITIDDLETFLNKSLTIKVLKAKK